MSTEPDSSTDLMVYGPRQIHLHGDVDVLFPNDSEIDFLGRVKINGVEVEASADLVTEAELTTALADYATDAEVVSKYISKASFGYVSVTDYGAVGDDATADTAAFV